MDIWGIFNNFRKCSKKRGAFHPTPQHQSVAKFPNYNPLFVSPMANTTTIGLPSNYNI